MPLSNSTRKRKLTFDAETHKSPSPANKAKRTSESPTKSWPLSHSWAAEEEADGVGITVRNCKNNIFNPQHFLRCHSRSNDPSDVQTQVWQCIFEPDMDDPSRTTSVVATCGGYSVCLVDVTTGKVGMKYNNKDQSEIFYALAWTTLKLDALRTRRINVLAAGGAKRTIYLFHPAKQLCYHEYRLSIRRKTSIINTLLFHPTQPTILLCGDNTGNITVWDIGIPELPKYDVTLTPLHTLTPFSEVFNLVIVPECNMLLAGCDDGLYGWDLEEDVSMCSRTPQLEFELPSNPDKTKRKEPSQVDSTITLENGNIAIKCANYGVIFVCNLKEALKKDKDENVVKLRPEHVLKWSECDEYFLSMGYSRHAGLLVCGDHKGALWVYDIHLLQRRSPSKNKCLEEPIMKLEWPEVKDSYLENARKLKLDVYSILIDSATIDPEGKYIIAVTSNNMVCIWKRTP